MHGNKENVNNEKLVTMVTRSFKFEQKKKGNIKIEMEWENWEEWDPSLLLPTTERKEGEMVLKTDLVIGTEDFNEEQLYEKGKEYHEDGRTDYAISCISRSIKLNPTAEKWHLLGMIYQQAVDSDSHAVSAFLEAIKMDSNHPARIDLAVSHYNNLNESEGKEEVVKFLESHRSFKMLSSDEKRGKNTGEIFKMCVEKCPSDHLLWCAFGVWHILTDSQGTAAVECYKKALALQPDNAFLHCKIAGILTNESSPVEAIEHYIAAFKLRPIYPRCSTNLGILHYKSSPMLFLESLLEAISL